MSNKSGSAKMNALSQSRAVINANSFDSFQSVFIRVLPLSDKGQNNDCPENENEGNE